MHYISAFDDIKTPATRKRRAKLVAETESQEIIDRWKSMRRNGGQSSSSSGAIGLTNQILDAISAGHPVSAVESARRTGLDSDTMIGVFAPIGMHFFSSREGAESWVRPSR